jgi:hypothetical protein
VFSSSLWPGDDSRVGADPEYYISMVTITGFQNLLLGNYSRKTIKLARFRIGSIKVEKTSELSHLGFHFLAFLKTPISCWRRFLHNWKFPRNLGGSKNTISLIIFSVCSHKCSMWACIWFCFDSVFSAFFLTTNLQFDVRKFKSGRETNIVLVNYVQDSENSPHNCLLYLLTFVYLNYLPVGQH